MKRFQSLRRFKWSDVPKRRRQLTYIMSAVAFSTYTLESKFKERLPTSKTMQEENLSILTINYQKGHFTHHICLQGEAIGLFRNRV